MKATRQDLRDSLIITIIILLGFMFLLIAGSIALRFAPRWELLTSMDSNLDPNSDFLTNRPNGFIEPINASILTPPIWQDIFLTPGLTMPAGQPFQTKTPVWQVSAVAGTPSSVPTNTTAPIISPTATFVVFPSTPTFTSVVPVNTRTRTSTPTVTSTPTTTSTPTNTLTSTATYTATSTPSNTPVPVADLQVSKSDGAQTYLAGGTLTYTIVVSNAGPSNAIGAIINDTIPPQITSWTWTCSQFNGATGCDPVTGSGATFSDIVDIPNGGSIQYTVTASISGAATGDLTNTVDVTAPAGLSDPGPNSASDTDTILNANTFPSGNIGETPDNVSQIIPTGSSVILQFSTPLIANGDGSYDLVLYELFDPVGGGINMDHIILRISDGSNWYTIFYWGNGSADTNSPLNINNIGGVENDNRQITPAMGVLYNTTGVQVDVDAIVPLGTYPYIMIECPPGDSGDGCEVDAITLLP